MKYKIGVDFGTTYSKVAYLDDEGDLKVFCYPGPQGKGYIPTAIAYQKAGGHQMFSLGEAAQLDAVNRPDISFCENFKMLLPLENRGQWEAHGWSIEKSPAEVVRDYFFASCVKTDTVLNVRLAPQKALWFPSPRCGNERRTTEAPKLSSRFW